MSLNKEQQEALNLAKKGTSFFLTGPGGSGKSYVLERIKTDLDFLDRKVAITAMTGCAALLLGTKAKTLHSWAAVGLAKEPATALVAKIRASPKSYRRWLATDTLIIDEVSMLTPEFLEKLNYIAIQIRRDTRPMGGIQVIFVGDFYQLPPVNKEATPGTTPNFVFESPLWKQIVPTTVHLKQIVRQRDPAFHKILEEARKGALSKESLEVLKTRQNLPWQSLEIRPTLLFSRKAEVDHVNTTNLKQLTGSRHIFKADTVLLPLAATAGLDKGSEQVKHAIQRLDRDAGYSSELILAEGAQVMLLKNLDYEAGLVNGSRGVVTGFTSTAVPLPLVKFRTGLPIPIGPATWESDDIEGLQRQQLPLRLAYAVTIHKAQGATLDCALIDIGSSTFECGQAYVALSRVRDLESLYIWDLEDTAFRTHAKVHEFYERTTPFEDTV
jgi:ATP-dependent DNA helicase PIF1